MIISDTDTRGESCTLCNLKVQAVSKFCSHIKGSILWQSCNLSQWCYFRAKYPKLPKWDETAVNCATQSWLYYRGKKKEKKKAELSKHQGAGNIPVIFKPSFIEGDCTFCKLLTPHMHYTAQREAPCTWNAAQKADQRERGSPRLWLISALCPW